jgi:hypothetical protein
MGGDDIGEREESRNRKNSAVVKGRERRCWSCVYVKAGIASAWGRAVGWRTALWL